MTDFWRGRNRQGVSGRRDATPPELPAHRQSHFTAEPAFGITDWWEVGMYFQTALLADGTFEYAGSKLRTKLVVPGRPESRLRWGVNVEVSRLPFARLTGASNDFVGKMIVGFR